MNKKNQSRELVLKIEKSQEPIVLSSQTFSELANNAKETLVKFSQIPLPDLSPLGKLVIPSSFFSGFASSYLNSIASITPQLDQITRSMAEMLKSINQQWVEDFALFGQRIEQMFIELETQSEEIAPKLQKANLWISPFMSFEFIRKIITLCKNPGSMPKDVISLYINFYSLDDYSILKEMVDRWKTNPFFEGRMDVIYDALDAHINRKYTLTVPTLLPLIEGVATDFSGKRAGHPRETIKMIVGQHYTDIFSAASKDVFLKLLDEIGFFGDVKQYFSSSEYPILLSQKGIIESECLNRHAILHGVQKNYASEINSLKAFLILDILNDLEKMERNKLEK